MTRKEKEIIIKAIKEIMAEDGDFAGGISMLCKLVGLRYPAGEIKTTGIMSMSELKEILSSNSQFKVK